MNSTALPGMSLASTTLGLLFLVALFAAALWLLKRSQSPRSRSNGSIQLLETQTIGPGQRLVLVKVEEQTLLLGVCAQSISLLVETESASLLSRFDRASER